MIVLSTITTYERKCHACGGYGTLLFDGLLRACKACNASGKVTMTVSRKVPASELISNPKRIPDTKPQA